MQIFLDAQLRKDPFILRDVANADGAARLRGERHQVIGRRSAVLPGHTAAGHRQMAGNAVDERGFTHPLKPHYAGAFTGPELEVDIPQRVLASVIVIHGT